MVKYIILLIALLLFSCTQYTAVTPPRSDYILTLNNNIANIPLRSRDLLNTVL